jgi:hypothetical protein
MLSRRALETLTAAITGAFGVAVVVSSLDNGIGWSSSGVESGTFPFMTGLIVTAGSLYNLVRAWLRGREIAVRAAEFRRTVALFLPAAVFVAVIPLIGMYAAEPAPAEPAVAGALGADRPCRGGRALRRVRADFPGRAAARPARRRAGPVGARWKISTCCCMAFRSPSRFPTSP